jgi:hypothetical protein
VRSHALHDEFERLAANAHHEIEAGSTGPTADGFPRRAIGGATRRQIVVVTTL